MRALILLLTLAGLASGQSISFKEDKLTCKAGRTVQVEFKFDGKDPRWDVIGDDVDAFRIVPDNDTPNTVVLRVQPFVNNQTVTVVAWCAKDDKSSPKARCTIKVGEVAPVPPEPKPPEPKPPEPKPVDPAPIPEAGFRVLILYESGDTFPVLQSSIFTAAAIRDYFDANCPKGPDGKTPEARIWDWDVDTSSVSDLWRKAVETCKAKAGGSKKPLILISNGKTGTIEPLPSSVRETLELLKKWRGE